MIDQKLVVEALQRVDTASFELFAQTFYGAMQDREFIPLGGIHDGGAEGFSSDRTGEPGVFVDKAGDNFLYAVHDFIQVSKQQSTRAKVRGTVKRLREYERHPKVLAYITSRVISDIDKEEQLLSEELNCKIRIRDAKFISTYINDSSLTVGAFHSYLESSIEFLYRPGESEIGSQSNDGIDRTLAVFLRQELDRGEPNSTMIASITDGLILWALRDTDPDKGKLLSRQEILNKIEETIPSSRHLIRSTFDKRLNRLIERATPEGRQVRHYRASDSFCLPYETRRAVAVENADDDQIKMVVSCVFEDRVSAMPEDVPDDIRANVVMICHQALERIFENQGLKLAHFLQNADFDDELYTNVAKLVAICLDESQLSGDKKAVVRRACLFVLRGTFYSSSEAERTYLGKLSRTYVLMLILRNDMSVVEHFSKLAGSFSLYVGSDILVRALSEIYLNADSQTTINMLKIVRDAGSTLILTERTVNEVATHIRAQILEFENAYRAVERFVRPDSIEFVDRLLIRSYFYAKLSPIKGIRPPENWRAFIDQFGSYVDIRDNRGDREPANYLVRKFGLSYESDRDMMKGLDEAEIRTLADDIRTARARGRYEKDQSEILAYNDAVQVLRIYQRRAERGEESPSNPFGFRTWWLTQDQRVRRGASRAIRENSGRFFMLRPEFIINYIGFAPSKAEVRKSYRAIFPSVLGVRLSSGIKEKIFGRVMFSASRIHQVDEARAASMVADLTERLKAEGTRYYDKRWSD